MTIKGVQGGIGNMSRGGGGGGGRSFKCLSWGEGGWGGLDGIIEACPGGSGTT